MSTQTQTPRHHGFKWWIGRILFAIPALIVLLIGGTLVASASAQANLKSKYPPLGQLVDVGGYKLHLYCEGAGSPTVVFDSGTGGLGLTWELVYPHTAGTTRVCIYDRAGYGWSEVSPKPRNPGMMAEELFVLLNKANITGPFVLVGHSYGGMVARQFAAKYPGHVVGLVFVDSAHEEQFIRYPASVRAIYDQMLTPFRVMRVVAATGVFALNPSGLWSNDSFAPQTRETIQALIARNPNHIATMLAELEGVMGTPANKPALLGNLPLIVLSHGKLDQDSLPATASEQMRQEYEQTWQTLQIELAALSGVSTRIVAEKSGHNIQFEQPGLVIDAVQQILRMVRK